MQRPIIFSTEMVRAILEGRKTQTRRVITKVSSSEKFVDLKTDLGFPASVGWCWVGFQSQPNLSPAYFKCPLGQPGDQLWVREAWATHKALDPCKPRNLQEGAPIAYRAGGTNLQRFDGLCDQGKWRPSIFMPRWVSRINLEITDVRVERIQDISEEDAEREGVFPNAREFDAIFGRYSSAFKKLWNSLNEKRGYGWDVNPWVWIITFKKIGDSK